MRDLYKRRIVCALTCLLILCSAASAVVVTTSRSRPHITVERPRICSYVEEVSPPYPVAVQAAEAELSPVEAAAEQDIVPEPEANNPYAGLSLTSDEKQLLARMAYSEAGNQSFDGQVAVVQVALNRYLHDAFHGSIQDILLAPYQFAVGKHYNQQQIDAVNAALSGHDALNLNTDVVFFSTGKLKYGSYYKTIGDHVFRTYT